METENSSPCVCVYVCMCVCMYVCMYVCTHFLNTKIAYLVYNLDQGPGSVLGFKNGSS
jgi:hypothetical protein